VTIMDDAARLLRMRGQQVQVSRETGIPVNEDYLLGMTELIVMQIGFDRALIGVTARSILTRAGCRTFYSLPQAERIMVCAAPGCDHMGAFVTDQGSVCPFHIEWMRPAPVCAHLDRCIEGHHHPDCPLWSLSDIDPQALASLLDQSNPDD